MPLTGSLLVTLSAQLDLRASDSGQGQRAGVVNRKHATSVSIGRFENNALTGSADENIATLHVQGGNILVGTPGQGVILKSPDGNTCRVLTIDNTGSLTLSAITCP